jgi:hypothetical protein
MSTHGEVSVKKSVLLVHNFITRKKPYIKCVCKFHWQYLIIFTEQTVCFKYTQVIITYQINVLTPNTTNLNFHCHENLKWDETGSTAVRKGHQPPNDNRNSSTCPYNTQVEAKKVI